jgi:RNA polymerase sigma-70 factor, ECF subfamily
METQGIALPMIPCEPARFDELAETLRRAQAGDLAAFGRIMEAHERRVLRVALRLLNNPQDAQDAAQEVFLRLYKKLKGLDSLRGCEPWLYRVTVNVCRDMARARRRWVSLEEGPAAAEADAFADAERGEQRRMVSRALSRLGEKERAALVLRDVEGFSTREVAAMLGSSEATVRSQICSARLKIRESVSRLRRRME